jgi:lysozyme
MDLAPFHTLIAEFEGLRLKAYKCPAGVWTIGYGSTSYPDGSKVKRGDTCTKERALDLLLWYVAVEMMPLFKRVVKAPLNNNELCALLSLCYNIGNGAFRKSTLLKKLNAGESRKTVADQFLKWNKGGGRVLAGLVRRREQERKLFLTASAPSLMFT